MTVFSAGIAVGAENPEGARALIQYLSSLAVVPAIAKSGLEPVASR